MDQNKLLGHYEAILQRSGNPFGPEYFVNIKEKDISTGSHKVGCNRDGGFVVKDYSGRRVRDPSSGTLLEQAEKSVSTLRGRVSSHRLVNPTLTVVRSEIDVLNAWQAHNISCPEVLGYDGNFRIALSYEDRATVREDLSAGIKVDAQSIVDGIESMVQMAHQANRAELVHPDLTTDNVMTGTTPLFLDPGVLPWPNTSVEDRQTTAYELFMLSIISNEFGYSSRNADGSLAFAENMGRAMPVRVKTRIKDRLQPVPTETMDRLRDELGGTSFEPYVSFLETTFTSTQIDLIKQLL